MSPTKKQAKIIGSDGASNVPSLLTAKQIYELLGIDKRSFYRLIASGRFPKPLRIGTTRTRWRSDSLRAWLDSIPAG